MHATGLAHLVCAAAALFSGAGIVATPKGTPRHRQMGRIYGLSMLGLNVTALLIYRLSGTFGPFHVAALLSLLTVIAGVVAVVSRRPQGTWLTLHPNFMSWSYVGLLAAAAAEARDPNSGRTVLGNGRRSEPRRIRRRRLSRNYADSAGPEQRLQRESSAAAVLNLSTVFQFLPVPRVPSFFSIRLEVRRDRPTPLG